MLSVPRKKESPASADVLEKYQILIWARHPLHVSISHSFHSGKISMIEVCHWNTLNERCLSEVGIWIPTWSSIGWRKYIMEMGIENPWPYSTSCYTYLLPVCTWICYPSASFSGCLLPSLPHHYGLSLCTQCKFSSVMEFYHSNRKWIKIVSMRNIHRNHLTVLNAIL